MKGVIGGEGFFVLFCFVLFCLFLGFFLQSLHCATNCLQHVRSSGQGAIMCESHATHRAIISFNTSCATWYERTAQLLSMAEFKSHLFKLYPIGWTINRWRKAGNRSRSTRRKPLTMSFRKCYILNPEDSSPKRDSNPHSSFDGRLGKQTC